MYPLLDIQTLIMLTVLTTENPLRGTFFSFWEVPYLGDLVSKSVLLYPLQNQSMLQLVRHVRKMYGWLDQLVPWTYLNAYPYCFMIVRVPLNQLKSQYTMQNPSTFDCDIQYSHWLHQSCESCPSRKCRRCIDQSSTT